MLSAASLNKGCYLGQEIVERIRSRPGSPSAHPGSHSNHRATGLRNKIALGRQRRWGNHISRLLARSERNGRLGLLENGAFRKRFPVHAGR